jgi:hypothetical protein
LLTAAEQGPLPVELPTKFELVTDEAWSLEWGRQRRTQGPSFAHFRYGRTLSVSLPVR